MKSSVTDYDIVTPIALDVWKDPQNYIITQNVRDEAWIYFRCWETAGEEAEYIGCLHFVGVWYMDSNRFSNSRGYPNVMETDLRSYYLVIDNSSLLKALANQRSKHDLGWENYDHRRYKHYVVDSHDFYINIVASRVTFSIVDGERATQYFDVWNNV